jgi:plasmid stabilization system protein ParE
MRISLHPKVHSDVDQVLAYYEQAAAPGIAAEFYKELRRCIAEAGRRPTSFPCGLSGRRRVNLRRFPYHLIFRLTGDRVRILVVRHHRRHPAMGTERR